MKQSQLFSKTRKNPPKDEVSKNARLLIQAGFIHKEMAGVYSYLPLGFRVLSQISNIIRKEMNAIGGQELFLTTLQDAAIWQETGRWNDAVVDDWFKTALKNDTKLGLAFTHEEPLTCLLKEHISSYKDLPVFPYQIQTKFRNELRAKSGIMRGREFPMKDMYSFTRSAQETEAFHEKAREAYMNVFNRVGIGKNTFLTVSNGGSFSKYSHEFQTLCEAGEDIVYLSREKNIAVNKDDYNPTTLKDFGMEDIQFDELKSIEVGDIYKLGTKFSQALGLLYKDETGRDIPVDMGCYGIGVSRLMGTVVEVLADEKGIVWPKSIAPFQVHIIQIGEHSTAVRRAAEKLYEDLTSKDIEVLYDDRADVSTGSKFADADLIGIPVRAVVSEKTIQEGKIEVKKRSDDRTMFVDEARLLELVR